MYLRAMPKRRSSDLERGRAAFAARAWEDAFQALSEADREVPLDNAALGELVQAAGLAGHHVEMLNSLERLHNLYLDRGDCRGAARAAFWMCMRLAGLGETAQAGGWLGRDSATASHCSSSELVRSASRSMRGRSKIR